MRELTIDEIKKHEFEILCAVDKFCRENNIKYILYYGTLLGAVRHKGFIPWDDDIDISMLREDYDRFISEFNKNRTDSFKVYHYKIDPDYPYETCHVQDNRTKYVYMGNRTPLPDKQYDEGIAIDLFVMDHVGNDKSNAYKLYKKSIFDRRLNRIRISIINMQRSILKTGLLFVLKPIYNLFVPKNYLEMKIDKVARTYENEDGLYVANISRTTLREPLVFEKSIYYNTVELEFEGKKFFAPKDYDAVLTAEYGDYMTPPPVEEQISQHGSFKVYLR